MNKFNLRSNAVIEFILVAPLLIFILDGIIEFGVMFYDKALITEASRAGARWGIVLRSSSFETPAQVETYTTNYLSNNLISFSTTAPTPTVTATQSSNPPTFANGDTLTVTVSYQYTFLIMENLTNVGKSITLTATTVMSYE